MPANLSPEYKAAEAAYRRAREPRERLDGLREMLRTIPKHKGTEHLQADIKARIKSMSEFLEGAKRGGAHGGPALVIRREGAAQLVLLGPPNSGKSALHTRLTASHAHVAPYPFTTQYPEPGMMAHEDVHFQLVDLPAVSTEHAVPWLAGSVQMADAALLVIDLSDPSCIEQTQALHAILDEKRVTLTDRWNRDEGANGLDTQDVFAVRLPTLLLANKADAIGDLPDQLAVWRGLTGCRYPALAVSASTGEGLGDLGQWLFEHLHVVRVYTKTPGHPVDKHRPFTLRHGQTVADVAQLVHQDVARALRYARIWGKSGFDGQHAGPEHVLEDGDIVELHT
jgi:ribosome-interacting GTPase 1